MEELVDSPDLESGVERRVDSNSTRDTINMVGSSNWLGYETFTLIIRNHTPYRSQILGLVAQW